MKYVNDDRHTIWFQVVNEWYEQTYRFAPRPLDEWWLYDWILGFLPLLDYISRTAGLENASNPVMLGILEG